MKTATPLAALLLGAALASPAAAQSMRSDVTWVRDVGAAAMTLDGLPNEAAWAQAEARVFRWNTNGGLPGSGQKVEDGTLVDPTDPANATLKVLRQGNKVWMLLQASDKSIGGGRALHAGNWNFDGLIMNLAKRGMPSETDPHFFGGGYPEFFYGWWHPADTTSTGGQKVNASPRAFGRYACDWVEDPADGNCTVRADRAVWDYKTTWQGTTNDDTHGMDTGYTMEMMVDAGALGYDFAKLGGDRVPWNFAVQDADFFWPADPTNRFTHRVWYQNQWANNFIHGVGYLMGRADVTTTSGALPMVAPDLTIPGTSATFTLDGALSESVWGLVAPQLTLQYKDAILGQQVGGYDFIKYFRPSIGGQNTAPVVDPSRATVKMVYKGDMLYVGVDVDDQAVSGMWNTEDGRDGLKLSFNTREANTDGSLKRVQFDFALDSAGAVRLLGDAVGANAVNPGAVTATARMKGTSTAANPNDVDTGYTIEIAIDLVKALGYPAGRGDGLIWPGANFYDGDFLPDLASSYATRVWWYRERADGPGAWGYMDPSMTVAREPEQALAGVLTLRGVAPNPARGTASLRYTLGRTADVTVDVVDMLGRTVQTLRPGTQAVGEHALALGTDGLSAGVYVYRLSVDGGAPVSGRFVVQR